MHQRLCPGGAFTITMVSARLWLAGWLLGSGWLAGCCCPALATAALAGWLAGWPGLRAELLLVFLVRAELLLVFLGQLLMVAPLLI